MDPNVAKALELLRRDPKLSITAAAQKAGAPRKTVSDNWHRESTPASESREDLPGGDLAPDEIPVIVREYDSDRHYVYPVGDVHIGSQEFQSEKWDEWVAYLASTDGVSFLGMGDFLNCAIEGSVSDTHAEKMPVREAKRKFRSDLKPLAAKGVIDLLIPGNHEYRVTRATSECPIEDVADFLEVPYAPASALVVYRIGDVEYEFFVRHGSGSGRAGAQANRMEREALIAHADVYVSGHTHREQLMRGSVFVRDGDKIVRRRQMYITSGSFLTYEPYAARGGLPPADLGVPRIRLNGRRKDVHAGL